MLSFSQSPNKPITSPAASWAGDAERIRTVYDRLMQAVARHDSVDALAQALCVITAETLGDLCSITLLNLHNEKMHVAGLHDADAQALALLKDVIVAAADMPLDQGLAARVMLTGEPVLLKAFPGADVRAVNIPGYVRYIEQVGIESLMVVPLKGRSGIIGAVTAFRHRGGIPYAEAELELLTNIALRMSIAIENALLVESLRSQVAAVSSAKAALAVSEQRFHSIFHSSSLGVEIMDPVGTVIDANPAFETMTGYAKSELVGRFFAGLVHPGDAAEVSHVFTGIKLNHEPQASLEHRLLGKDGATIWLRTSFAGIRNADDGETVNIIVAVHENISGRVRTEQYFKAILEATPDALIMADAEGRVILINRQAEKLLGYARLDVLGKPLEMLLPMRFREQHPEHRHGYMHDPATRPMGHTRELFALLCDGSELPVEVSLSYLEMDSGPVVVAAVRDITERKQREAALVRSERSLAQAQDVARLGSLEYDISGDAVEASDEALRILGMERADLKDSKSIQDRIHPHDLQAVMDHMQGVLNTHTAEEFEFRVVGPDGRIRIVHDRVAPFFSPEGQATRLLATFQDVTEQRQAEQEMKELKNRLQTSVELERLHLAQELHDGPMQDLYGASYRIDELQDIVDVEAQVGLQEVNQQVQHTIGELRDIARELRPPALSNFGLEKAIRSYAHDFEEKHPNISVQLSLARDHQLLPEPTRLALFRVLQQALTNVLRHSQADHVDVLFSLDAEEARLVITDNGKGFHVPDNWVSFVRRGHYGLAGSAERLNALGGSLRVESEPGKPTTISASVPWSRPAQ